MSYEESSDTKNKVDDILVRLTAEFVETARDQLEEIEIHLDWLDAGRVLSEEELFGVQRGVHNIKGQGQTFGHPVVGRVAHLMEDYMKSVGGVHEGSLKDLRVYIDVMRDALAVEDTYSPEQVEELLRNLPSARPESFSEQETHDVNVLLVMPRGVQRRVVSEELLSCGFHVNRAHDGLEALSYSLDLPPDVVVANFDLKPFNGLELARVFSGIARLSNIHFMLFTAYDSDDSHLVDVPDNVAVVEKRQNFAETLSTLLMEWGMFGKITL